jgi:hypothetical protein
MPSFKFKYKPVLISKGKTEHRPIVTCTLGQWDYDIEALMDTGSSATVFDDKHLNMLTTYSSVSPKLGKGSLMGLGGDPDKPIETKTFRTTVSIHQRGCCTAITTPEVELHFSHVAGMEFAIIGTNVINLLGLYVEYGLEGSLSGKTFVISNNSFVMSLASQLRCVST